MPDDSAILLLRAERVQRQAYPRLASRFLAAGRRLLATPTSEAGRVVEVGEMWTASIPIEWLPGFKGAEHARDRGELLSVVVVTREGLIRQYTTPFTRGPFGGLKLGDTEEMKGFHPNYLTPVFRVWQRQQFYKTQDGRDSMVWEPDLLAPCPCGGSKRFGECCKSSLPSADRGHVQDRVLQAISAGDPDLAESIARNPRQNGEFSFGWTLPSAYQR